MNVESNEKIEKKVDTQVGELEKHEFKSLQGSADMNDIDRILDIPVNLIVELGRTRLSIKNLLQLAQGSVVELDGVAGEPMSIYVNNKLLAHGEVVQVNDRFGVRLTDIVSQSERLRNSTN